MLLLRGQRREQLARTQGILRQDLPAGIDTARNLERLRPGEHRRKGGAITGDGEHGAHVMAGQHPCPVSILRRAEHARVIVGSPEELLPFQFIQNVVGTYGTGQLVVALAAGRRAQQVMQQQALLLAEIAD
jgi:hypothetical protein